MASIRKLTQNKPHSVAVPSQPAGLPVSVEDES
jgi:hypothetical protein